MGKECTVQFDPVTDIYMEAQMKSERKIGALLSYIATVINIISAFFLTPFLLRYIGDAEYGVYRTVQSLTGQLALITVGLGTIMTVLIARYNAQDGEKTREEKENLIATGVLIGVIIALLVLVVGGVLFRGIDSIYGNTMTPSQVSLTKQLYIILVINVALTLFRDVFVGITHGYERFIYVNGMKVLRLTLRIVVIIALLLLGFKSLALVLCDLTLTIIMLFCDIWFCFGRLGVRAKFHGFDRVLFQSILSFSLAIILQTFVNQVNQNLDGAILGAMVPAELVTVYSLALTIYVSYNSVSSAFSSMFTPEAARLVQNGASFDDLHRFTVRVGRYLLLAEGLLLGGFVCVGQNFVRLWVGAGKEDVYGIALILLLPMTVANTLAGANSVLDGYMKRMGRSLILVFTAVVNIVVSVFLITQIGYWGAAVGTAVSVILGQIVLLSWHYHRVFQFSMIRYLIDLFRGIVPSIVVAVLLTIGVNFAPIGDVGQLLLKGVIYVLAYFGCLWLFGATTGEKNMVLRFLRQK